MKKIALYGAGGHAYAAIELIRSLGEYHPEIIFDDAPEQEHMLGVQIMKFKRSAAVSDPMCISIGNNHHRQRIASMFDLEFPSFIHSSAVVYPSASIGAGSLIHPNAVIDAACSIGSFNIINNNATVSHNCETGDFVHIAIQAAVAGGVSIGKGTLVGAGSVILPEIKIGKWVTIGAGAVVTRDLPDHVTVYGNPARIISMGKAHE